VSKFNKFKEWTKNHDVVKKPSQEPSEKEKLKKPLEVKIEAPVKA